MMRHRTDRHRRRGFTLLELLLVLVILGVLAALVVPRFANRGQQARETAARSDIDAITTALETYEIDNGTFPDSLAALRQAPASATNWNGPYLRREAKDPWGNEYVYRYPGQRNPNGFDLYSLGPDGREGNDDIGNF